MLPHNNQQKIIRKDILWTFLTSLSKYNIGTTQIWNQ